MPAPPAFVPRDLLEHPDDFGVDTDVTWRPATTLDGAVRLARAIDQHTQAVAVGRWLRRGRHSMTDLADAVGERPETLASKLRGRRPAPDADLVVWSWMAGTARRHRPLAKLVELPEGTDPAALLPAPQSRPRVHWTRR